jgi:hypothetical protein
VAETIRAISGSAGTVNELRRRIGAITACAPAGLAVAILCSVANAALVNWYQPTRAWKYVMWEGGALEWLTALSFLAAGGVYLGLALTPERSRVQRAWFAIFAIGSLALAGEELNWGRGMLVLNLDDPWFDARYNTQGGNLHNAVDAVVPVLVFAGLAGGLRITAHWSLRLVPIPAGFLNAVVIAAASIPFMNLQGDRFLFLDEVLEWSGATLIFCLALHYRYGWFFLPQRKP